MARKNGNFDEAVDWLVDFLLATDQTTAQAWQQWSSGEITREEFEERARV